MPAGGPIDQIRYGVIGCGMTGVEHIENICALDGAVVTAIADPVAASLDRAQARAMLDLCMFAEGSVNEQEISVVGDAGKLEALVTESVLRIARRAEHVDFARAIRQALPSSVTLSDGMWSVAIGVAGHHSIDARCPIDIADLPELASLEATA